MIKIETAEKSYVLDVKKFTDGTFCLKPEYFSDKDVRIRWIFESNEETLALYFISKHFINKGVPVSLVMPYLPNARQDRVKDSRDVFTLKYFAELINSIGFEKVYVFDVHSDVSLALINNVRLTTPRAAIRTAISKIQIEKQDLYMFYPDEGAVKRYSEMINKPYAYGIKNRDWETREIRGLSVQCAEGELKGKDILMIDDICSSGKTLLYAAKKLKEKGVNNIYLYVSHCENQIKDSELLNSDIVKRIFTTNSILTFEHEKIEIVKDFKKG